MKSGKKKIIDLAARCGDETGMMDAESKPPHVNKKGSVIDLCNILLTVQKLD